MIYPSSRSQSSTSPSHVNPQHLAYRWGTSSLQTELSTWLRASPGSWEESPAELSAWCISDGPKQLGQNIDFVAVLEESERKRNRIQT